jgi:hypothetical protein
MKYNLFSAPKGRQLTAQGNALCKIAIQNLGPHSAREKGMCTSMGQLQEIVIEIIIEKEQLIHY